MSNQLIGSDNDDNKKEQALEKVKKLYKEITGENFIDVELKILALELQTSEQVLSYIRNKKRGLKAYGEFIRKLELFKYYKIQLDAKEKTISDLKKANKEAISRGNKKEVILEKNEKTISNLKKANKLLATLLFLSFLLIGFYNWKYIPISNIHHHLENKQVLNYIENKESLILSIIKQHADIIPPLLAFKRIWHKESGGQIPINTKEGDIGSNLLSSLQLNWKSDSTQPYALPLPISEKGLHYESGKLAMALWATIDSPQTSLTGIEMFENKVYLDTSKNGFYSWLFEIPDSTNYYSTGKEDYIQDNGLIEIGTLSSIFLDEFTFEEKGDSVIITRQADRLGRYTPNKNPNLDEDIKKRINEKFQGGIQGLLKDAEKKIENLKSVKCDTIKVSKNDLKDGNIIMEFPCFFNIIDNGGKEIYIRYIKRLIRDGDRPDS